MSWRKKEITLPDGSVTMAQLPVIVSASRSTDIPAFYGDWLINRMKEGYVKWRNPFNGVPLYVSFCDTQLFVFWTKNPAPFITHLDFFDEVVPAYYFQFTLNSYDGDGLEPGVPPLEERMDTFMQLSERIGKERVIWRFDPLLLTDKTGVEELLQKVEYVGNILHTYTEKLVFSFADIGSYRKVGGNLRKSGINYREFDENSMLLFAAGLQQLNASWGLQTATCAEAISLDRFDILPNRCIDGDLITRLFPNNKVLMDFVNAGNSQDRGQRKLCGCMMSKDIGMYNSCPHLCVYCYANSSPERVLANYKKHRENPYNDMIS